MITSVALFPLLGYCSLLLANVAVFAAPTTYDQRQDGNLNLAAKVENILVVVAIPQRKSETPSLYSDALEAYLTQAIDNNRNNNVITSPVQVTEDSPPPSANNDSANDEGQTDEQNPASSSSNEEETNIDYSEAIGGSDLLVRPARSLTGGDFLDDRSPKTLFDNELPGDQNREKITSIGQNGDTQSLDDSTLKLIGDGIENCGPERRRDSYGNCQWQIHE